MRVLDISVTSVAKGTIPEEECPKGYKCTVNQFMLNNNYRHLRFAGFPGNWVVIQDAASDESHVYWRDNQGISLVTTTIDLVPFTG